MGGKLLPGAGGWRRPDAAAQLRSPFPEPSRRMVAAAAAPAGAAYIQSRWTHHPRAGAL